MDHAGAAESINATRLIVTYLAANGRCRRCPPSLAAGAAAYFSAPHIEGRNGRAEYMNNEKVFTVFQGDLVSRSTFFPRMRCVLSAVGMGWLTYLYEPLA